MCQDLFPSTISCPAYLELRNGQRTAEGVGVQYDATIKSRLFSNEDLDIRVERAGDTSVLPDGAVARVKGNICRRSRQVGKPVVLSTDVFQHQPGYSGFGNVMQFEFEGQLQTVTLGHGPATEDGHPPPSYLKVRVGDEGSACAWFISLNVQEYRQNDVKTLQRLLRANGQPISIIATADFGMKLTSPSGRTTPTFFPSSFSVEVAADNWRYFSPISKLSFELLPSWISPLVSYGRSTSTVRKIKPKPRARAKPTEAILKTPPASHRVLSGLSESSPASSLKDSPGGTVVGDNSSPVHARHLKAQA